MKNVIIFTDLDGTLLDDDYSFHRAAPALSLINRKKIPLIICSSKTRSEIELYRRKLSNNHPFISENGGGIFIPAGYFPFELERSKTDISGGYIQIRLGADYKTLRKAVGELRLEGFNIRGFGDMTVEEVARVTGLPIEEALLSKKREFDEPFIYNGAEDKMEALFQAIRGKGFFHTQGRFCHILGSSDKGLAVRLTTSHYGQMLKNIMTIGLGDSLNDAPMLASVNLAVLVKKPDGTYEEGVNSPDLIKSQGIGPEGWNSSLLNIFEDIFP